MVTIKLLSGPYQGQELEYSENANPLSVFRGLALHSLEWKTIWPEDIDPTLLEKWIRAEMLVRKANQEVFSSMSKEEEMEEF